MTFIWSSMLWSLILIPLLIWLYLRMQKRRSQLALRYGSLGLVTQSSTVNSRRHIPAILFLLGMIILFIALARPQMVLGLPNREGIVILAFDVSGSMAAQDFEPNRLEAAKQVAIDFVSRQPPTVRIGVVAFSEGGFSVQIPSNDQAAIIESIQRLTPQRGTSLANGIIVSLNTIANVTGQAPIMGFDDAQAPAPLVPVDPELIEEEAAVIVLLTDGENNMNPDPVEAARFAYERGVRIHTIAVGSVEGTTVTVNGVTVFTQVNEAGLKQISELTGGLYFNAQNEEELAEVYESIEPNFVFDPEETEVTAVFAGLSILILLTGGLLSLLWFSRVP
ncbi:MAG: VWA domain-containing protein [Anaerolineales bacterium]|nr:VWA domain-containing protein [Anaerolineales bacterium]